MENFNPHTFTVNKIILHAGTFHADDVFCDAVAKIINPSVETERRNYAAFDETDLQNGIIMADIGGGIFDHHQADAPYRYDGVKHCALSRLWLEAGATVVRSVIASPGCIFEDDELSEICKGVYDGLIRSIAIEDNGEGRNPERLLTVGEMFSRFVPEWNDSITMDQGFNQAVEAAMQILRKEILHYKAVSKAKAYVHNAISRMNNGIIILDQFVPWEHEVCLNPDARIIIYLSSRQEYNVQLVPVEEGSFKTRIKVPDEWKGKRGQEAEDMMEGMTFCHINGFLSCFRAKEQAVRAAEKIVSFNK